MLPMALPDTPLGKRVNVSVRGLGARLEPAEAPVALRVAVGRVIGCEIPSVARRAGHGEGQRRRVGSIVAVALTADRIDRIARLHVNLRREVVPRPLAREIDHRIEERLAMMQDVEIGGGVLGDALEIGCDLDLLIGHCGPPDDCELTL